MRKITKSQAERVLAAVARQAKAWVTETCHPVLVQDWQWMDNPAPLAVVWEEGPYDWAYLFPHGGTEEEFGSRIPDVSARLPQNVFCEAVTGWSIAIYPND